MNESQLDRIEALLTDIHRMLSGDECPHCHGVGYIEFSGDANGWKYAMCGTCGQRGRLSEITRNELQYPGHGFTIGGAIQNPKADF